MNSLDDLFSQAITAVQNGDDNTAVSLYNTILAQDNGHFGANYMMACESMHNSDVDQARVYFQKALYRQPEHPACRFQAGLLELTSGNLEVCAQVWAPLEQNLSNDNYFKLFVQGCLAMAMDRFEEAEALLVEGIKNNTENPALNRDMAMLLNEIRNRDQSAPPAETAAETAPETGSTLAALQMFQQSKLRH